MDRCVARCVSERETSVHTPEIIPSRFAVFVFFLYFFFFFAKRRSSGELREKREIRALFFPFVLERGIEFDKTNYHDSPVYIWGGEGGPRIFLDRTRRIPPFALPSSGLYHEIARSAREMIER